MPTNRSRAVLITIATVFAVPLAARAQSCPDPRALANGLSTSPAVVRYLADDALEGRLAGSPGERCAGDYIAEQFRGLGLDPMGDDGTFFADVELASSLQPHSPAGLGRNVIAVLEGRDPQLAGEYVVMGAHYDHLGRGGFGSLAPGDTSIHNGADDNASGVAALVRAAELLAGGERPLRSILFIAFTGEEFGLLGSARFVASDVVPPARMRAMLNMDMVGRLEAGPLIIYGVDTATEWRDLVAPAAAEVGIPVALQGEGFGPSDHTSFYARDVPVLHFFTNVHADYHRPSDEWEKIDAPGIDKVAALVADIARSVADNAAKLTLVRGAGAPPRPAGDGQGYDTYLGSIPDFSPVERGVLLSGVGPGSPAEQAGIEAGDIIIRLGEHEVANLQGLTDALRAHKPGDTVPVKVLRNGEEQTLTVRLASRNRLR